MTKSAIAVLVVAALVSAPPALAAEDLVAQIETIAPSVVANDLQQLGGPQTAAELIQSVDGRWFTLTATVRNWHRNDDKPGRLQHTIDRRCSDDVDISVSITALGPDSFRVEQRGPDGKDEGTMDLVSLDPVSREFSMTLPDDQILMMMELEDATPAQQEQALQEARKMTEAGAEIWLPTPDLMVTLMSGDVEVWGRCPL